MDKDVENVDNAGEIIQETIDVLRKKGLPPRTASYAAAMGYMRASNPKKRRK